MFGSVSWLTLNFQAARDKLSVCSRRKDTVNSPIPQKQASWRGVHKKHATTRLYDSDKSTDTGGSDNFTSDTGKSDSDAPIFLKCKAFNKIPSSRPPPGLSFPPGLDAPPGLDNTKPGKGARLNSQAAVFVPSGTPTENADQSYNNRLRESIHKLKASLEEWEADAGDVKTHPTKPTGSVDDHSLLVLQDAVSKLNPQEAAMVRSFLKAKESGNDPVPLEMSWDAVNTQALRNQPQRHQFKPMGSYPPASLNQPVGARPMNRPFEPFRGTRREYEAPWRRTSPEAPRQQQRRVMQDEELDPDADSLRTNLRDLAALDSARVIMVRRINKMGLDSAAALETYFAKFGTIERVMVSHSRSKSTNGVSRLRPATVGFVVMSKADEAKAAFTHGIHHLVQGVTVELGHFQSHAIDA